MNVRAFAVLVAGALSLTTQTESLVVYQVPAQQTDPAIQRFTSNNYVTFEKQTPSSADLLVFMSGTEGTPEGAIAFLKVAAGQGYRVISLAYNDTPAVVAVCKAISPPRCAGDVREKRIFGDNVTSLIDDLPSESIVHRLSALLTTLDRDHPGDGWGGYLDGAIPNWSRIVVSGHSQGAGMAAYIAQRKAVKRVVLFSSPWDFYGRDQELAPWILNGSGVTPADRWYAAYHEKENTASIIARAYRALKVPASHIRVFTLEPRVKNGANPYHLSMVGGATPRDANGAPAYADQWRFLVGTSPGR